MSGSLAMVPLCSSTGEPISVHAIEKTTSHVVMPAAGSQTLARWPTQSLPVTVEVATTWVPLVALSVSSVGTNTLSAAGSVVSTPHASVSTTHSSAPEEVMLPLASVHSASTVCG